MMEERQHAALDRRSSILGVTAALLLWTPSVAQALPNGFSQMPVASGLSQPTAFAFKGNQIFVTEKASGQVRVVRPDGSLRPFPLLTVNVSAQSERALLGIALDPDFANNKFLYIYYTTGPGALGYTGSPKNRVSRFTFMSGTGTASDETIIVDNIPSDAGNHNGGDIQFGFDGALYVAVGDGGECTRTRKSSALCAASCCASTAMARAHPTIPIGTNRAPGGARPRLPNLFIGMAWRKPWSGSFSS